MKSGRRIRLRLDGHSRILKSLAALRAVRDIEAICSLLANGR